MKIFVLEDSTANFREILTELEIYKKFPKIAKRLEEELIIKCYAQLDKNCEKIIELEEIPNEKI